ncbi:hypothetical protein [Acidianus sp. HS-5]|uniref:hypothetical protein n=1 Tax=Acidianus sp. HS-5 TaxID=2886040 RepID=UPI001F23514F|nr:hypothetical protein [Acidianus sp. HS-5]BDC17791.1 hypothetical protein HS5_06810 [Acidianus sp. HS-5]
MDLKPVSKREIFRVPKEGNGETRVNLCKDVVEKLDGIIGWLTLFGNFYAVRKMSFNDALGYR